MLPSAIISACESFFGKKINAVQSIGGGSINEAYRISIGSESFFIKTNQGNTALENFTAEAKGLNLLASSKVIKIPPIIKIGKAGQTAFLILEYIESGNVSNLFWEKLGTQLAQLHQSTSKHFGLDHSNFIGSLPQQNNFHSDWTVFFIHKRMLPQIQLAEKNQLLPSPIRKQFDLLFKKLDSIFPKEKPALTHGDLWSGNFLKGKNDTPVLIDPAVSFAHREMDLAMSLLFGGFDKRFYESYNEVFPLQPNFQKRVEIYQLYYLMVHVNLFGKSYLTSVQNILANFGK